MHVLWIGDPVGNGWVTKANMRPPVTPRSFPSYAVKWSIVRLMQVWA